MKKHALHILFILVIMLLQTPLVIAEDDSGTFRGKWWNYYDRGIERADKGENDQALSDLKKAVSLRSKDQLMARTYGMHFMDYFPHREIGVIYYIQGDLDRAITELEASVGQQESAKAIYFLNKVRKEKMLKQQVKASPPVIAIESPRPGTAVKELETSIRGRVKGDGLISRIRIGSSSVSVDLAAKEIGFEKTIKLEEGENRIVVVAEDLLGNRAEQTFALTVDREGPSINLSEMAAEMKDGKKFFRIRGEVDDSTGIKSILVNGKALEIVRKEIVPLDIMIDSGEIKGKLLIQAFDMFDNETRAEIDAEKEITLFNRKEPYVMLAFNGAGIFSSDKDAPVLTLKGATDIPEVYVDRYYVEGEVFDNKGVEKILVNNKEISIKKGKKIFFNKIIPLAEGKNRVSVQVFDGSGNKASNDFSVTRHIPSVMQTGNRMSITVLPFEAKQKTTELTGLANDYLTGSLTDQKRFNVIERAKLEQVLLEQKLTKSKLTDPEHSIRVGKLMSAEAILATSIKEDQKSVEIISRVINTETSQVMEVKDVFTEDKSASTVKELIDGLATKIALSFPLVEGMVIKKEDGTVYTDLGARSKIKKDSAVIVYRKGKEIKHPVTGKSLGFDTLKIAEGRFEDVQDDFSKAKILDKPALKEIQVKDLIVTK